MGNNNYADKYNKFGAVDIRLFLKNVCLFPGENMKGTIKLIPKMNNIQECKKYCQLNITITQHSHYIYPVGSDYETDEEIVTLMTHNFHFSDFINLDDEFEINLAINYAIPTYARPSIYMNKDDYVKHFITIEYPHFQVKRTFLFAIKNHLNYHSLNRRLLSPFVYPTTFNKKKLFKKKGSCQLIINMPRNFFQYNEKIQYNINLDCRILQIPVYKISVTFCRTNKKNFSTDTTRTRRQYTDQLFKKEYKLNKDQKLFNISDYIIISEFVSSDGKYVSPSRIYQQMDNHGPYEITDTSLLNLFPSCSEGLLQLEYFLKFKVYFDSILTSDESVSAPVDFCDILGYIIPNLNKNMNPNIKVNIVNNINTMVNPIPNTMVNQIPNTMANPIQNTMINPMTNTMINPLPNPNNFQSNLINNNNINLNNNNIINNDNIDDIINDESAPPMAMNINIDGKKDYLEDKENIDLKDWVIIDK